MGASRSACCRDNRHPNQEFTEEGLVRLASGRHANSIAPPPHQPDHDTTAGDRFLRRLQQPADVTVGVSKCLPLAMIFRVHRCMVRHDHAAIAGLDQ
jgi:hypothetical protein